MATGSAGRVVQLIFAAQRPGGRSYVTTWDPFAKLIAAVIVFCLLCGIVAAVIGHLKNLSVAPSFALGAFLGPYGVAKEAGARETGLPKAPAGMRSVKCPCCNAVQNIGETQADYECSQCKTVNAVTVNSAIPLPPRDADSLRQRQQHARAQCRTAAVQLANAITLQ